MDTCAPPKDRDATAAGTLTRLPLGDFIAGWRVLTGEPPAIMLDSRPQMIALLVAGIPPAPLAPCPPAPGDPDHRAAANGTEAAAKP